MAIKSLAKTRRIGGSLVVTIPKKVVEQQSIEEGEMVKVNVEKVRINGFGMLKGIGKFTRKDRMEDRF